MNRDGDIPTGALTRRNLLAFAAAGATVPAWPGAISAQPMPITPNCGFLRAADFGARGDGTTDDTSALNALFVAMQARGQPGMLGGDRAETRYLVRPGEWRWTFRNDPIVAPPGPAGPTLCTSGKVVIVAKPGGRDAPLLSIHNDPLAGTRLVYGGYLGGLWFEDRGRDGENRHGLNLFGVQNMRFGPMFSDALQGDLIHIESQGGPVTADAWHVSGCVFEGATTWNTGGWTFNNDSVSQVFNFNQIHYLLNINGARGAFRGPGAGNIIHGVSCYTSRGWAIDLVPDVGTVYGMTIHGADLDAPELGIRIDGLQASLLHNVRITHRLGEGPIPADMAWPREALRLGGPSPGTVTWDISAKLLHRLWSSITPDTESHLGVFTTFSDDPTLSGIEISHRLNPSVRGLALPDELFLDRLHPSASNIRLARDGKPFFQR